MLLPAVRWYSLTAATENPSPSRAPALLRSPRAAAALPRCRAHCSLARPNPRAQHGITNYVIGALDVDLETYLKDIAPQLGVRIAILSLNSGLTTGDYGWNTPAFKRMAKFKFLPVQVGLPPPRTSFLYYSPVLMSQTIPSYLLLKDLLHTIVARTVLPAVSAFLAPKLNALVETAGYCLIGA